MLKHFQKTAIALIQPPQTGKVTNAVKKFRSSPSPAEGINPGNVPKSLGALTGAKAMHPGGRVVMKGFRRAG